MLSLEHSRSLLKQRIDEDIVECEFERKGNPKEGDTRSGASWRDHLLRTFSVRLAEAGRHKAGAGLTAELDRFVSELESLDETADLYSWQARTATGHYSGWTTEDRIIHITKSKYDNA